MGVTRIESNRNCHFGLKIESKSIENRNLEIVTSLNDKLKFKFSVHQGTCCFPIDTNNTDDWRLWDRRVTKSIFVSHWMDGWLGFNGILSMQVAAISCLKKFKVC